jgi:predicted XRE-type DNA-binding protein
MHISTCIYLKCVELDSHHLVWMKEKTATKRARKTVFIKGRGDVFVDLCFTPTETRDLRLRSQMMTALRKFIEKEGLTQAAAAKRLKVSQPTISDLTRGKLSRFSLDA